MTNATQNRVEMTNGTSKVVFRMVKGIKGATINGKPASREETLKVMSAKLAAGWRVVTK